MVRKMTVIHAITGDRRPLPRNDDVANPHRESREETKHTGAARHIETELNQVCNASECCTQGDGTLTGTVLGEPVEDSEYETHRRHPTGMDLHVDVEPDALARPVSPPAS
ncbi:MAG: hypothetical protein ACJAZO_001498 [Myxococcota bacterium]|jgi:hypothetical protein